MTDPLPEANPTGREPRPAAPPVLLERLAQRQHKIERAAHDIVTGRTE